MWSLNYQQGPGNIGKPKSSGCSTSSNTTKVEFQDNDAIWTADEVPDCGSFDESVDPREKPDYDIKYRQRVSPEDIYLQMGGRTPSTSSCEDMVVSIPLPGETFGQVDLTVTEVRLDVRSPRYRLGLPLPFPVDSDSSRAQWDEVAETLTVTLRMNREFDFVNF